MENRYYQKLELLAKPWLISIGFILIVIFNLFLLPMIPELFGVKLNFENILDLHFSYSPDLAYQIFESLDNKGRKVYFYFEALIDFPYLLIYTLTYVLTMIALLRINRLQVLSFLIFLPITIGFLDFFENVCLVTLLSFYPKELPALVIISSYSTSLKWIFGLFTAIVIIILVLRWLILRRRK